MRAISRMFRSFFYRVKYRENTENFPKLIDVVLSCDSTEQCIVAMKYIGLYNERFASSKDGFGAVSRAMISRLISYLQDLMEHNERGWHKPEWNNYSTVRTYPDLNNYLGDILGVKFKRSWVRGTPSVIPG